MFTQLSEDVFDTIDNQNLPKLKKILSQNKSNLKRFINKQQPGSLQTPLMMSVLRGHDDFVQTLLSFSEVDASVPEKDGYTPMHGAGFQGRAKILKMLKADSRKIDVSARHRDGYTPIHRACWGNEARHTETVKAFVEAGVAIDEATSDGRVCFDMTKNVGTIKFIEGMKEEVGNKSEL